MTLRWKKTWIADETFESAGVFDVNGDGMPDIVSGAFWYEGPDFRKKHYIGAVQAVEEYYDDFSTIALDINGNGRFDYVTGGWWGKTLRWLENPGKDNECWPAHEIAEPGCIETTRAWDIDGDGVIEIIPNNPGSNRVVCYKLKTDCNGKGLGEFTEHVLFEFLDGQTQGHGLGCGDIAGNGRMDIVLINGWLEAPENPLSEKWIWHPDFQMDYKASVPILVEDVNGDGINELIVGNGHGYGLDWWEHRIENGQHLWTKHPIDPFNAQYHDLIWADIDGDGQKELVTGKRHRGHCGKEAGEWDDYGIYYFKWTGEGFAKQVISYGGFGEAKGCGIHFALADLRGTGRLDVVAPGKDGLYVFYNEGAVN